MLRRNICGTFLSVLLLLAVATWGCGVAGDSDRFTPPEDWNESNGNPEPPDIPSTDPVLAEAIERLQSTGACAGCSPTGANLRGWDLKGVDLSRATWTDGSRCREGSIGTCLR